MLVVLASIVQKHKFWGLTPLASQTLPRAQKSSMPATRSIGQPLLCSDGTSPTQRGQTVASINPSLAKLQPSIPCRQRMRGMSRVHIAACCCQLSTRLEMAPLQALTPLSCPHIRAMAALDQLHSVAAEWWTAGGGLIGVVDVGHKPQGRLTALPAPSLESCSQLARCACAVMSAQHSRPQVRGGRQEGEGGAGGEGEGAHAAATPLQGCRTGRGIDPTVSRPSGVRLQSFLHGWTPLDEYIPNMASPPPCFRPGRRRNTQDTAPATQAATQYPKLRWQHRGGGQVGGAKPRIPACT